MEPLLRTAPLPPANDRQCAYCRRIFCNRVTRRNHRCSGVLETQQLPPITIGSAVVEWVDTFKYLGHVLNSDLSDSLDFETRIRKAQGTFLWPHNVDFRKKAKQIPLTEWWEERQVVLAQRILKWPDDDPCRAAMGWSLPVRILTDYKAKLGSADA